MIERDISRAQVIKVLEKGKVIENYEDDKPFPSALIPGFASDRPTHVVVALEERRPQPSLLRCTNPRQRYSAQTTE